VSEGKRAGGGHDPTTRATGFPVACLTVSDRCASGERADRSGPRLEVLAAATGGRVAFQAVVPDDIETIRAVLRGWLAEPDPPRLILTSGGTGPTRRDVTPEAVEPLLDRRFPGIEEALRQTGLPGVPTAVLGRGLAGLIGATLVVNLPGSPSAVDDAHAVLVPVVGHLILQLQRV
jgi:molybdenum cofactor synthesis domain-containing protein